MAHGPHLSEHFLPVTQDMLGNVQLFSGFRDRAERFGRFRHGESAFVSSELVVSLFGGFGLPMSVVYLIFEHMRGAESDDPPRLDRHFFARLRIAAHSELLVAH